MVLNEIMPRWRKYYGDKNTKKNNKKEKRIDPDYIKKYKCLLIIKLTESDKEQIFKSYLLYALNFCPQKCTEANKCNKLLSLLLKQFSSIILSLAPR